MQQIRTVTNGAPAMLGSDAARSGMAIIELLEDRYGSLAALMDRFLEAGLAPTIASWIGDGQNMPISTGDLRRVLGERHVKELAMSSGLTADSLLRRLARRLPAAVRAAVPAREIE